MGIIWQNKQKLGGVMYGESQLLLLCRFPKQTASYPEQVRMPGQVGQAPPVSLSVQTQGCREWERRVLLWSPSATVQVLGKRVHCYSYFPQTCFVLQTTVHGSQVLFLMPGTSIPGSVSSCLKAKATMHLKGPFPLIV